MVDRAKYCDISSKEIFHSLNSFPGKNAIRINCDLWWVCHEYGIDGLNVLCASCGVTGSGAVEGTKTRRTWQKWSCLCRLTGLHRIFSKRILFPTLCNIEGTPKILRGVVSQQVDRHHQVQISEHLLRGSSQAKWLCRLHYGAHELWGHIDVFWKRSFIGVYGVITNQQVKSLLPQRQAWWNHN